MGSDINPPENSSERTNERFTRASQRYVAPMDCRMGGMGGMM
jgi:hypothetical protein